MIIASKHFRIIAVITTLSFWICYMPSHFQKGGVNRHYYYLIPAGIYISAFVWILFNKNYKWIERIGLAIISPFVALFISTFFIMPPYLLLRYRTKTWFLWENQERIITNAIYYGVTFLLVYSLIEQYKWIKKRKAIKSVQKR